MVDENSNGTINVYIKKEELEFGTINGPNIDYTSYKDGRELLTVLEDDGTRWATAFAQFYKQKYDVQINVEYAFVWFASAIEECHKIKNERAAKEAEQSPEDYSGEFDDEPKVLAL